MQKTEDSNINVKTYIIFEWYFVVYFCKRVNKWKFQLLIDYFVRMLMIYRC